MTTITIDRRSFLAASSLGLLGAALAGSAGADGQDPIQPVQAFDAALLACMRTGGRTPFAQRAAILAPAVDCLFDLPFILRQSVGPRWTALPADDQGRLETTFRRYTVANYAASFDRYDGERIDIVGRRAVGQDVVVDTRIGQPGEAGHALGYVMRNTASVWKAVDVLVDGAISRVAVQRSDFRSILANGGGGALLSSLQRKITDLSGGSLA